LGYIGAKLRIIFGLNIWSVETVQSFEQDLFKTFDRDSAFYRKSGLYFWDIGLYFPYKSHYFPTLAFIPKVLNSFYSPTTTTTLYKDTFKESDLSSAPCLEIAGRKVGATLWLKQTKKTAPRRERRV
jgi:hypothetical protein